LSATSLGKEGAYSFSGNEDKNKTNDIISPAQGTSINNRITVQGSGAITMSKEDA
jgi:hypothetical protein